MKKVPRKNMVRKSKTLLELGQVSCSYPIKIRLKEFEIRHKDGSTHSRGPCVSFQQFNPDGHFLSAISINAYEFQEFLASLQKIKIPILVYEQKGKKIAFYGQIESIQEMPK